MFRSHTNKVMSIIDQVINALKNKKLNAMREKLVSLGERHHIYGVKKEFLAVAITFFIRAQLNKNKLILSILR